MDNDNDWWKKYVMGGVAACGAVTVSNPMEVVRTRLQLQGELTAEGHYRKHYTGVFQSLILIYRNEGVRGLQKGLLVAYPYQMVLNGVRLGLYEPVVTWISSPNPFYTISAKNPLVNFSAGALTGALGAVLSNPLFMMKTRFQSRVSHGSAVVGQQHLYRNPIQGFYLIWKADGFHGLFRGSLTASIRTAVGSASQLTGYHQSKHLLLDLGQWPEDIYTHLVSSLLASVTVCLCMNPFDVVLTRIYNQKTVPSESSPTYRGILDSLVRIARLEGLAGLYKGCLANYCRLAPHTVCMFVLYEQLKSWFY
jgi:solute carrier family 25, member 34/35